MNRIVSGLVIVTSIMLITSDVPKNVRLISSALLLGYWAFYRTNRLKTAKTKGE